MCQRDMNAAQQRGGSGATAYDQGSSKGDGRMGPGSSAAAQCSNCSCATCWGLMGHVGRRYCCLVTARQVFGTGLGLTVQAHA
jgi:hypothetical protein